MISAFDLIDRKNRPKEPVRLECVSCGKPGPDVQLRRGIGDESDQYRHEACWVAAYWERWN